MTASSFLYGFLISIHILAQKSLACPLNCSIILAFETRLWSVATWFKLNPTGVQVCHLLIVF